jgi:hypothetical protein
MSQLSLETAKLPEMTWLRSTIAPMMMVDHSEFGNWGALAEVSIDIFMNLRSFMKTLSRLRVLWRSSRKPGPDRLLWIDQGNSVSSDFCLFVAPEIPSGDPGHFEPTDSGDGQS